MNIQDDHKQAALDYYDQESDDNIGELYDSHRERKKK